MNILDENIESHNETVPVVPEKEEIEHAPEETPSKKTRKRRTNAEIIADEQAARDAMRAELLAELRDQGLLLEGVEGRIYGEKALEKFSMRKILALISSELRVPKNRTGVDIRTNKTFNFRNADDIIREAKKVAGAYGCSIYFDCETAYHSDNFCYLNMITHLYRISDGEEIVTRTPVRDAFIQPGAMSSSFINNPTQCSGAAMTYAKKQALTNLFLLDDSEMDPDMTQSNAHAEAQARAMRPVVNMAASVPVQVEVSAEPPVKVKNEDEADAEKSHETHAGPSPETDDSKVEEKSLKMEEPSKELPKEDSESILSLSPSADISEAMDMPSQIPATKPKAEFTGTIFDMTDKPKLEEYSAPFLSSAASLSASNCDINTFKAALDEKFIVSDAVWQSLLKMAHRA